MNKGDGENPNYRSRFVAKECNTGNQDGLFASTPPLEAPRLLIHDAATENGKGQKSIMINDVSRAFFEAQCHREVCIELPPEEGADNSQVGVLVKSLYGTRDAAANFQREVRNFMTSIGFQVGKYNPSTYFNPTRQLRTFVHGDDFVVD